jgi:hypothetical protein
MKGKAIEEIQKTVKEKSSVAVEKSTRLRLDKLGSRHETYDMIINRLIDEHEHKVKK